MNPLEKLYQTEETLRLEMRSESITEAERMELHIQYTMVQQAIARSEAAATLGRKGGSSTSEAKRKSSRENGKRGGRPKSK